jgi:hypothetical protein
MFSLKNQLTMPRNKKKSQWIPELINQVCHREALGHKQQRRVSSGALEGHPKGVRVQQMAGANQAFHPKKTNNSMKTGPNEAKSRLQAALWVEVLKSVSLGWVGASSHSLEGSQS